MKDLINTMDDVSREREERVARLASQVRRWVEEQGLQPVDFPPGCTLEGAISRELEREGFTDEELIGFMRCLEHVDPRTEEGVALERMDRIVRSARERRAKTAGLKLLARAVRTAEADHSDGHTLVWDDDKGEVHVYRERGDVDAVLTVRFTFHGKAMDDESTQLALDTAAKLVELAAVLRAAPTAMRGPEFAFKTQQLAIDILHTVLDARREAAYVVYDATDGVCPNVTERLTGNELLALINTRGYRLRGKPPTVQHPHRS